MADNTVEFNIVVQGKNVSVVQKQTDKLAKSTDRAGDSTERLTKKQDKHMRREKGVGQMGMNTTKSFSKMQQTMDGGGGGGGLVRAYALLAANVFALTAAFGVLSRSAQIDTLIQSMEVLSTTGGIYIKNLAKEMQAASGYAIDLAQAFSQVSLAASAGLSTKEIEGLTTVAKGAAISLGRNLPDAMDRIFRGAIKLEPEILDEIGLFVRVDEAAQKYARNNGKVVSSLTQVEKRQAFLNEILEQGTRKFQEYAEEIKPDPYVRIGAALGDIAQEGLSLVNSVFGPLLGFLAESRTLLTLVFGALVAVLLKKAIPAMGLMTKGAAELAQERAQAAKDYSDSITANSKKAIEADLKVEKSARKSLKDKAIAQKRFASRADKPGADLTKLDKAKLGSLKRQKAVEDRILVLKKAQRDVDNKNQRMIKEELAMLREEQAIEERLLALKQKGGIAPGSLAERRQQKLDSQARVGLVVAGAAGTMETQGIREGWRSLNEELRETEEVGGKVTKKFNLKERSTARLKGGISALGVGMNKLMMIMGPLMMIISVAVPVFTALGKSLGLNSKESKALTESITKLDDAFENIEKRFTAQAKGMHNMELTYRSNLDASIAFHKNLTETATGIIELTEEFKEFMRTATPFAQWWEGAKGWFGFGREAKVAKLALEGTRESLHGLIRAGEDSFVQIFDDAGVSTEKYATSLRILMEAEEENERITKKYGKALEEVKNKRIIQNNLNFATGRSFTNAADAIKYFTDRSDKYGENLVEILSAQIEHVYATRDVKKEYDNINPTQEQSIEIMEQGRKKSELLGQAMANLASAIKGAEESIGKFNQAMMPKTKVDDILGSFDSILAKVRELEEQDPSKVAGYFTGFADTDNPLKGLFKDMFKEVEEIDKDTGKKVITRVLKDSVDTKVIKDALKTVQTEFEEYRVTIIKAKAELNTFKQTEKNYQKIAAAGRGVNKIQQEAITNQRRKEFDVAEKLTDITLRNVGYERDVFLNKVAKFKLIEDEKEQEKWLTTNQLTRIDILAVEGQMTEEANKNREKRIAIATESWRVEKQVAEEGLKALNAEKELVKLKQTTVELELKLAASRRGAEVRDIDTVRAGLKAAKDNFMLEVAAAKLKSDILEAEHEILKIRMKLLFLEAGMATQDPITKEITLNETAQGFMTTLGKGFEAKQSAIGVGIENAALRFGIATTEAIGNSFKSGSGSGILGAIKGAAAGVAAAGTVMTDDQGNPITDEKGNEIIIKGLTKHEAMVQVLKASYQELAETMKDLGPAGTIVAGIAQGSLTMMTAYDNLIAGNKAIDAAVADTTNNFGESDRALAQAANTAEMVGGVLSGVGQMLAANSKGQIQEIDQQIAAEKKRDGKSKESLAKIAQLEKKKEAMQRKAFEQNKKVQMAVTIANTAASIMAALSAPPIGLGPIAGMPMAVMAAAMGALQLAVISKTKYQGGSSEAPKAQMTALTIGKRTEKVDVSRGASGGELGYLRGQRGMGGPQNFVPTGGAAGLRRGYAEGGVLVGERGPEVIAPRGSYEVTPNDELGGGTRNVNFTINAVDAAGVEEVLMQQRGNIIGMIREAANNTGERFLESVDTDVVGVG